MIFVNKKHGNTDSGFRKRTPLVQAVYDEAHAGINCAINSPTSLQFVCCTDMFTPLVRHTDSSVRFHRFLKERN